METRLQHTLASVNEWVRFAEAKNAALVAANGALLIGLLQVAPMLANVNCLGRIYAVNVAICGALGFAVGITSFLPTVDFAKVLPLGARKAGDNVFFFGAAARFSPEYYLSLYYEAHDTALQRPAPAYELQYAQQIVINSRIAVWKYDRFRLSAWCALFAVLTPPVAVLAIWVDKHTRVEPVANAQPTPSIFARRDR